MEMSDALSKSLYDRLGGAKGIQAVVNDAIDSHVRNPAIGPRFLDHDIPKLKQLAFEFFCAGTGGLEKYTGRDMRTAHTGMNISEQEFLAVIDDIVKAMEIHGVGSQEKNEVIAVLYSMKEEIIRV